MPRRKVDRRTFLRIAGVTTAGAAVGGSIAAHIGLDDNLLLGLWRYMLPIPRPVWQSQVRGQVRRETDLDFMSEEHHWVRDLVVLELPRVGNPLSPEFIAQELNLPIARVGSLLDDLEEHKTFLFRNEQGAVAWAYPVTVDRTPHHVTFSTGEQVYAA